MLPSRKGDHCAIHAFLYFLAWGIALPFVLTMQQPIPTYLSLIFMILGFLILWLPNKEQFILVKLRSFYHQHHLHIIQLFLAQLFRVHLEYSEVFYTYSKFQNCHFIIFTYSKSFCKFVLMLDLVCCILIDVHGLVYILWFYEFRI